MATINAVSLQARIFNALARPTIKPVLLLYCRGGCALCARLAVAVLEMITLGFLSRGGLRRAIGGVNCDIVQPSTPGRRTVLYLHGGGFSVHAPNIYRRFGRLLAERLQAEVVIPDYRLAPRHRYPAGADDCFAVYAALLAAGRQSAGLIVMGDSAGGNLALSTLLRARDQALPLPACAVMLSPGADLTLSGASHRGNAMADPLIPASGLPGIVSQYVDAHLLTTPYVSPLFADFTGLPPLAIHVGSSEVLLDCARGVAVAAERAGIPVELKVWQDMPHVFPLLQFIPEARAAVEETARFVLSHSSNQEQSP